LSTVELAEGDLRLSVDPALGGSVRTFRLGDVDLLRPTPGEAADVLATASFPLAPYANRIAHGRFAFGGRTAQLAPNLAGQPHPLHGDGWRGAWTVERADARSAALAFAPEASAWPWRYGARQAFELAADALAVTLCVENLDDAPGLFGLGFHPYFPHSGEARLTARTSGVWLPDAELLPARWAAGQPLGAWAEGAAPRGRELIDHCHTGWDGEARIDLGAGRPSLRLTASPELAWLHIYAPPDQDFFCVEPVSHAPNAFNMADPQANGVRILAPGERLEVWMRLQLM
jgi:aldose 1-epimerase